jgi:ATP-dependent helicase/nuclease subunit A
MIRDAASQRQVDAATPTASTWLSANAGSGKTRVLTDRVARLLLSGVQPQHILCLTYTKAAATEMQNRLFKRLGDWAMKPDADLLAALSELGDEGRLKPGALAKARQLFARAIETPGGLRIQTIHSFCATLLRRFPLEAGVSPQFTELDDRAARLMREQIINEMADHLAPEMMAEVAAHYTGDDFFALMEQVARHQSQFAVPKTWDQIAQVFDLPQGESADRICADVFLGHEQNLVQEIVPKFLLGTVTDQDHGTRLSKMNFSKPSFSLLAELEDFMLTKDSKKAAPYSAKIGSVPTKDTRKALGAHLDPFNQLMQRVELARARRLALLAAQKSAVLHRFAKTFLPLYAQAKSKRGLLDFDDLILRARDLLTDRTVAAWVLFRLDGGIDHILVDEAQDTSPTQWQVVKLLTEEFSAGIGATQGARTLFVVGDKKQSIYSFQGADVAAFDENHSYFETRFKAADLQFQTSELEHSFRSSNAVLRLVDMVFGTRFPQAMGDKVSHIAFWDQMPGRVDLWPLEEAVKDDKDEEWENPIDLISQSHHTARLADRIAAEISAMIADGVQIPDEKGSRAVHAGDFLILVQRRSPLFHEIIRACKKADLPIAGADRLNLSGELAVKDLAALLSFLATPEDDLSLAAFLRSPLGGWSEGALYDLAQGRKGYLWEALRADTTRPDTLAMLTDLRDQTDFLRPYDLLERILTRHDGRRRLITRLGVEAEDGIDALLSQALDFERSEIPSLTGFLNWLISDDITVKRQMDSAGNRIRVMTVHGAKGLEAPIVILPDTCDRTPPEHDEVFVMPDGTPIWKTAKAQTPTAIESLRAHRGQKTEQEALRLLYVALTRAKSWLIVAGAGEAKPDGMSWYRLVAAGMQAAGAIDLVGGTQRFAMGDWPANGTSLAPIAELEPHLPIWATLPAADAPPAQRLISPSDLGGDKVVSGQTSEMSLTRGTALHLLLEHLPQFNAAEWPRVAARLILDADLCTDVLAEAAVILRHPNLTHIFAPDTLSEVAITAPVTGEVFEGQILGSIDRLLIGDDVVLAVDFKSNQIVPNTAANVPEGLLRQMGAYAAALELIYPDKRVDLAILWTVTAQLMPLDRDMLRAAFARASIS